MAELRRPGDVPEEDRRSTHVDVAAGLDTDGDGRPDTVVTDDGVDLVLHTDLDGDRLADQVLRIGPDGLVRETRGAPVSDPGDAIVDGLRGGVAAGTDP